MKPVSRKASHYKTAIPDTGRQLIGGALGTTTGRRGHYANFKHILPRKMAELVERGLFVRDDNVEGGYRITDKGRELLARLEGDNTP